MIYKVIKNYDNRMGNFPKIVEKLRQIVLVLSNLR